MVPARVVLYIMSFTGFLVSFVIRTDMNIAIVAMVKHSRLNSEDSKIHEVTSSYCQDSSSPNTSSSTVNPPREETNHEQGEFEWTPIEQSQVLSSFFWTYSIFQLITGPLSQRFGNKAVFEAGQLISALCSFLIPIAANLHYGAVIALRLLQGAASSVTWPAMYAMTGHWIPPNERSRFMSSFQGMTIGVGLTYVVYGYIIAHYGWRIVFYISGSVGVIWCVFWHFFVFDTPAVHPRISQKELLYIQHSLKEELGDYKGKKNVPWRAILTSCPVWANVICGFGRVWIIFSFLTCGPTYMKTVLGYNIQSNGVLSGIPYLLGFLSALVAGYVADIILTRQMLSLTNIRKLFTAMGTALPAILTFLIGYLGCDYRPILVAWFIAVATYPVSIVGNSANAIDMAPNFSGEITAMKQTLTMPASFLSSLTVGLLTEEDKSLRAWRIFFNLGASIGLGTYIVYHIFGSSNIQPWNFPNEKDANCVAEDAMPLNDIHEKKVIVTQQKTSIPLQN